MKTYKRALSIAGFDGSGGAGIQADLKTFSALGCYGMTVLTSIPVQNTTGVKGIYDVPLSCIREQLDAIFQDTEVDVVKVGMLHSSEIIELVVDALKKYRPKWVVTDPVMRAKSGDWLLLPEAVDALKTLLFPLCTIITPNLAEASGLVGWEIQSEKEMEKAAKELYTLGPKAIVIKGGHMDGPNSRDCLYTDGMIHWMSAPRTITKNLHGTGCTFSAAIASYLALGFSLQESVSNAKAYLTKAIERGAEYELGRGHGPVHHFHAIWGS